MATNNKTTGLRWEDPEPLERGPAPLLDWGAVAAALRERPGVWALILEDVSSGVTVTAKRYGLEVTVRGVDKTGRVAKMYARWPENAS